MAHKVMRDSVEAVLLEDGMWISVDDEMPSADSGFYDCLLQVGSMSYSYCMQRVYFRNGKFSVGDWTKVLYWRED